MLTPAFELKQDKSFLTVLIKAPFAKVAETEIFIEEDDFKFFSKPYFLRLTLPGKIVEDGREKADYNADTGEFTIVVPKETPGEHFEGLDMLTKLLEPKGKKSKSSALIEVIDDDTKKNNEEVDEEEFDWCVEQVPYKEQPSLIDAPKYGFANQKSGVFARLQEDMVCIVDCSDPDNLTAAERREQRIQAETDKFDEDHYIADLYEDDLMKPLLNFIPHWQEEVELVGGGTPPNMAVELTDDEKEVMRKLPRKEYILDADEETHVYLGLLDILYAYCYNHRTTEGENNCESGWTICKISSTLSWLEVFSSIEEVIRSCYRRSLCYPLYRHWKLNQTLQQDVVHILQLGRRIVLKVLLEIRQILMDQDCRYVLNDLYITDYCVWIQSASEKKLKSLSEAVSKLKISKTDVGLNLPELEKLAQHAIEGDEQEEIENLTEKLIGVHVDKESDLEESDTESDSDTTDSDDISSETEADTDDVIRNETDGKDKCKACGEVEDECDTCSVESAVDNGFEAESVNAAGDNSDKRNETSATRTDITIDIGTVIGVTGLALNSVSETQQTDLEKNAVGIDTAMATENCLTGITELEKTRANCVLIEELDSN